MDGSAHRLAVIGPDGTELTLEQLPAAGVRRWTYRQKGIVVIAVRAGLLSFEEASARYALGADEFAAWVAAFEIEGYGGLRARTRAFDERSAR